MTLQFLYILNVILFSRLVFMFKDGALSKRNFSLMIGLQLAGLFMYRLSLFLGLLALLLVLIGWLFYLLERRIKKYNELRLISLLVYLLLLSAFFTRGGIGLDFNTKLLLSLQNLDRVSLFFSLAKNADWLGFHSLLTGILLATNEVNFLIRFLFQVLELAPVKKSKPTDILVFDRREYNAGRVIGILERIFTYLFILNDQIGAIGFILAAKGFVRFKELDNREFAEYVLIGTLLSILLAIIIAVTVKSFYP